MRDAKRIFEKQGLTILRWGVGLGNVEDFILFIYLTVTEDAFPKEPSVTPAKRPGRKQAIVNAGENDFGCINKAKKSGVLEARPAISISSSLAEFSPK